MAKREVPSPLNLVLFVVIVGLVGAIFQLQAVNRELAYKLDQEPVQCHPVEVICDCSIYDSPAYDQGWEDGATACGPSVFDMTEEDIRDMCQEVEDYGYIPGC